VGGVFATSLMKGFEMRIILVHGINQEGKNEAKIKKEWLEDLKHGLGRAEIAADVDVHAPFYGDLLKQLTDGTGPAAVAQGTGGALDTEELMFFSSALNEQAQAAGVERKDILAEERAQAAGAPVEQSLLMNRRLNAVLRALEKISPVHGDVVMRFLRQAYAYLKKPGVAGKVDAIVRPVLDTEPAIIVAHSLGTIVTFKLLRTLALEGRPIDVPLFVTVGSPLPLTAVQAALGPAFLCPKGVGRWLNAVDPADVIALGQGLDKSNFADGIDNIRDIQHTDDNPHSIQGYLGDRRVALPIAIESGI
jgi:hypothetical protein